MLNTGMRYRTGLFLLGLALLLKLVSIKPEWVEKGYTYGIYPLLSQIMRWLTGWLPFSLGDLVYAAAGIGIFYFIWKSVKAIRKNGIRKWWKPGLYKIFCTLLLVYLLFNVLW